MRSIRSILPGRDFAESILPLGLLAPRSRVVCLVLAVWVLAQGLGTGCQESAGLSLGPNARPEDPLPSLLAPTQVSGQALSPKIVPATDSPGDLAIWPHSSIPAAHEVSLFRGTFRSDEPLNGSTLHIFADTRYEVWIDGVWVGRGPARFSTGYFETDVYDLGTLPAGLHLIAALVQWAPNVRRSESTTPFLQAHVEGVSRGQLHRFGQTGQQWKSVLSSAWRTDSAPVHNWGLVGPTEILDLRALPPDWMQPGFSDDSWPPAVVKQSPVRKGQPRSIPFLENISRIPAVIDAGVQSPGRTVMELNPSGVPFAVRIDANPSRFTVEMLVSSDPAPSTVRVDGVSMNWQAAGASRPDVLRASWDLLPGPHELQFGASTQSYPFVAGDRTTMVSNWATWRSGNAGARLLLAEPVSQPDAAIVSSAHDLDIGLPTLPAYVVLDLGRTVYGRLSADVTGPSGSILDIGWDERLLPGTRRPLPYPGTLHPEWNQTDSWIMSGTERSISTLDARSGRYIVVSAWGNGPVRLDNVRVLEETYPVQPRGSYRSSDPELDRIWEIGATTTRLNMTDAYTDTPWRERGQWWGDAYVEDRINRVAFGDTRLVRRGVLLMADALSHSKGPALAPNDGGEVLLDYAMLWAASLWEYVQLTGDRQLVIDLYPVLNRFMAQLAERQDRTTGLIELSSASREAYLDVLAHEDRKGQSTAVNAMYYGTLQAAANLADAIGDGMAAASRRQQATGIKQQVNKLLFVPAEHRYLANLSVGATAPSSPLAQAYALAFDLVPESEESKVADSLLAHLSSDPASPNVETYGMFWVLEALGHAGRATDALSIVKRNYGRMLDLGATTWWETFRANERYSASLSHGWSGGPTWFLSTYLLGARRTGFDTWIVKPSFQAARRAQGRLPLGEGDLGVEWNQSDCNETSLSISSPRSTRGQVVVPLPEPTTTLALDGAVIWQNGAPLNDRTTRAVDGVHVSLTGGNHSLIEVGICR